MTQTNNRIFDEMARLMNDAAGVAQGVRKEFDTLFRSQAERMLRDLDVVQREEFEAVKEMARLAREENEALKSRIAALEGKVLARLRRKPRARRLPNSHSGALKARTRSETSTKSASGFRSVFGRPNEVGLSCPLRAPPL